ncbi:bifunctional nicotinamidase/pyrazinamidase [Reichenbachiella sp. MALMAid0571]|uniref:bifunctional nicotinamidase/pyrazinamidase n=1 Tax=Reichenbachiella sp. MALMAid0571 TaxID=3143939 RepID=UPI0032DFCDF7
MKNCLIIVDVQNDFLPGGALAVPNGDEVIPFINSIQNQYDLVVATQDWHPANHGSFAANHPDRKPGEIINLNGLQQILWPTHCVQNSLGAKFSEKLRMDIVQKVFVKGTDPGIDSYSGFYDNGKLQSTGLHNYLQSQDVGRVTVVGLAADYCVKFTAIDATELGYSVKVLKQGTRAVNLKPTDFEQSILEMKSVGIIVK